VAVDQDPWGGRVEWKPGYYYTSDDEKEEYVRLATRWADVIVASVAELYPKFGTDRQIPFSFGWRRSTYYDETPWGAVDKTGRYRPQVVITRTLSAWEPAVEQEIAHIDAFTLSSFDEDRTADLVSRLVTPAHPLVIR